MCLVNNQEIKMTGNEETYRSLSETMRLYVSTEVFKVSKFFEDLR